MLSLTRVTSGQAGTYYSKDDYYLESGGLWQGKGADNLGLSGKIDERAFSSLVNGTGPNDEFKINAGGKETKHTAGVDLTFSAPKSVSIAGLVLDDKRILEAHNKAVTETINYVESNLAKVRLKTADGVYTERTDNLIAAKFQHVSSRELDPQLHTHCLVFNASQKTNGDWRAVDYKKVFDNKKMLGQLYRNELAKNLKELGYQIEADNKGFFELKGMDPVLMKEFSTRSEQIKARAEELRAKFPNAGEAQLKAMATLDSRKTKDEPSLAELKLQWDSRVSEHSLDRDILKQDIVSSPVQISPDEIKPGINQVILQAAKVHTATQAVIPKEDILKTAMTLSMSNYSVKELENSLINHPELKGYQDNSYFTTKELAALEISIVKNVKEQQGTQPLLLDKEKVEFGIVNYELKNGFKLTEDQKNGVMHILGSTDRVIAIQGDAGTGKTTMLDCVNDIVAKEKINLDLKGLSYTGKAAHEIEQASNIESQTIARFINGQKETSSKPSMFVIDEASMLSIKDMGAMLNKIDDRSRIVLIGDTKQLQSIGAGKIFSTLQDEKAVNTITMKESKRQTVEIYKETAVYMSEKLTGQAFDKLNEKGKIIEVKDRNERLNVIADKYCENYKDTILVTATNKDREELNNKIRDKLQEQGKIGKGDIPLFLREAKSISEEQKGFCENYAVNDLVIVNSSALGKAGFEGNITAIDKSKNTITISDVNENKYEINLKENGRDLSVYKEKFNHFTNGEKIVFLKNDKGLKVSNGQTAIIKEIADNGKAKLLMENGKEKTINLSTQYKYVSHGYAVTDYKAQGQTAKNVIYHAETKAVNYNQAYVSITRGKEDIAIFTDDKDKFKGQINLEQQKTTVHEFERSMMKEKTKSKDFGREL